MDALWLRILKTAYRKDPVVSFVVTMGAVDAVIGGVRASWSLFGLGMGTVGMAIALRLWLLKRSYLEQATAVPEYYLPPNSSRPQLPILNRNKKHLP
ncbi:MAG: hypothetical protein F6K40_33065 [Okeania sp. SIO3I5]|uniref:hypothetical protein n=1 Tax=Okeania sp. SIO3I5 TaxID=2607805 RepID=UPI0013BCD703|nr:hypothetical protein [Okeania sp. SIO3I5]NEQ40792.1 hypothetical protein [Okeania sp. SIO3I5]